MMLTACPLHARLVASHHGFTRTCLDVFGKEVHQTFSSPNHESDARAWVAEWNAHFVHQWDGVRGTSAAVLNAFVDALRREGVPENTITNAIESMKHGTEP